MNTLKDIVNALQLWGESNEFESKSLPIYNNMRVSLIGNRVRVSAANEDGGLTYDLLEDGVYAPGIGKIETPLQKAVDDILNYWERNCNLELYYLEGEELHKENLIFPDDDSLMDYALNGQFIEKKKDYYAISKDDDTVYLLHHTDSETEADLYTVLFDWEGVCDEYEDIVIEALKKDGVFEDEDGCRITLKILRKVTVFR